MVIEAMMVILMMVMMVMILMRNMRLESKGDVNDKDHDYESKSNLNSPGNHCDQNVSFSG